MPFGLENAHQDPMFNDDELMEEIRGMDPEILIPKELETLDGITTDSIKEKFKSGGLESAQTGGGGLEAIVKLSGRPALLIQNDTFEPSTLLALNRRLDKYRSQIEAGIKSVGRLDLINHPTYGHIGTAWMIEEDVMITNRHVAELFSRRRGDSFFY